MVLPLSEKQQSWMRLGRDAGDVYNASLGSDLKYKTQRGSEASDAVRYLKYVCAENKKLGVKLKFEFRRVAGRHGERRRWCAKSLLDTVVARKGTYLLFGKPKMKNRIYFALLARIAKADCVKEQLEIYSAVATGMSRKGHAVSIRNDDTGVKLFDNACTNDCVEFTVTNLTKKMIDSTHCYYYDLYEKGKNCDN